MTNSTQGAPDFALSQLDGLPWEFPLDAAGRPVLLVFFETDCPTCLLTLPYLNRLDETLGDGNRSLCWISASVAAAFSWIALSQF